MFLLTAVIFLSCTIIMGYGFFIINFKENTPTEIILFCILAAFCLLGTVISFGISCIIDELKTIRYVIKKEK
jgi:hypothetical protein